MLLTIKQRIRYIKNTLEEKIKKIIKYIPLDQMETEELQEQKELYEAEIKHYKKNNADELVEEIKGYLQEVQEELDKRVSANK